MLKRHNPLLGRLFSSTFLFIILNNLILYPAPAADSIVIINGKHYVKKPNGGGYQGRPDLDSLDSGSFMKAKLPVPEKAAAPPLPPDHSNTPNQGAVAVPVISSSPGLSKAERQRLSDEAVVKKNIQKNQTKQNDLVSSFAGDWIGQKLDVSNKLGKASGITYQDVKFGPSDNAKYAYYKRYVFRTNGHISVFLHKRSDSDSAQPPAIEYRLLPADNPVLDTSANGNQLHLNYNGVQFETLTNKNPNRVYQIKSRSCEVVYPNSDELNEQLGPNGFKITGCTNKMVIDYSFGSRGILERENTGKKFKIYFPKNHSCEVPANILFSGSGRVWKQKSQEEIYKALGDSKNTDISGCHRFFVDFQNNMNNQNKMSPPGQVTEAHEQNTTS